MPSQDEDARLAQNVKAKIYVKDAKGDWVKGTNKVTLHEGDYILSGKAVSTTPPAAPAK